MPLPIIDARKFTQITNDWAEMFPEYGRPFKRYKGNFSKLVGPFKLNISIAVESYKDKYSSETSLCPFFVQLPDFSPAYLTVKTMRNGIIGWQGHTIHKLHEKAAEYMREHSAFPLEGEVRVSDILKAYKIYSDKDGFFINNIESPALLCGWCGKPEFAPDWIKWGREKYLALYARKLQRREALKGTPEYDTYDLYTSPQKIDKWAEEMHQRVQERDYLHHLAEEQIKRLKYDKIPRYELIIDI